MSNARILVVDDEADIRDLESIRPDFEGVDYVIHLAAIPSVIYGLWGIFVLAPILRDYVQPLLSKYLGWTGLFGGPAYGIGMLAAGNSVVFNPHPAAKRVSAFTIGLLNQAIQGAGGPPNLLVTMAEPTIESAQKLFEHPGISLLVAGFGVAKLLSPAVDAWSEGKELIFGFALVAIIAISFVAAVRLTRRPALA